MDWDEERLLYRIAKLYYDEDYTQAQISKELGIYRTTIGRKLKKARDKGIVKIEIQSSFNEQYLLEEKISNHFGMKEVIILPSNIDQSNGNLEKAIGEASFKLLDRIIKDGDVIGLAWGNSLGSMVEQSAALLPKKVDCVPLVGGPGGMSVDLHVNAITYKLADLLKGTPHFIDAAAIYKSKETTQEILNSDFMKEVLELWERLNVAIVGIGTEISSSNMVWSGFLGESERKELIEHNVIGEICSRFFTIEGKPIVSSQSDRTIAVQLEKLKNLQYVVGIAYSIGKAESIIGAMRGKFINILVTNEETAIEIDRLIAIGK